MSDACKAVMVRLLDEKAKEIFGVCAKIEVNQS
jgi:hypothetical protein